MHKVNRKRTTSLFVISLLILTSVVLFVFLNQKRLVSILYIPPLSPDKPFTKEDCARTGKNIAGQDEIFQCITLFADDFESVCSKSEPKKTICRNDITFSPDRWHSIVNLAEGGKKLGSPKNTIEISSEQAHSGSFSLKTYTTQNPDSLERISLQREALFFPPGSNFWYSAWYYIPGTQDIENLFIFDVGSIQLYRQERRLLFAGKNGNNYLILEGKTLTGPDYYQLSSPTIFPRDQWVHIKVHLKLSTGADGVSEVWQDGKKIVEGRGQNMPRGAFYDVVEVGQTSNSTHKEQTLFVDDVVIADTEGVLYEK